MSKRSGRKARHAQAAAPPPVNPAAPGQSGGQYRPLSDKDCHDIYKTALRLLSDLGMGEVPDRLWADLVAAGAHDLGHGRIALPSSLVEDCILKAPKTFPLHGRDPDRTIEVGGQKVYFGTGGAAVNTLQDALTNVAWFTRCCIATDMTDEWSLDVNTTYALMANTSKPVATAFTLASHVAPLVDLFNIASDGAFNKMSRAQHPRELHHSRPSRRNRPCDAGGVSGHVLGGNSGVSGYGECHQARSPHGVFELAAGH